jgi:hypothetical protein
MKTGNKTDLYETIRSFQQTTLAKKPTLDEMISEVRLMNFKIRPVSGNISTLDFKNMEFIDALWSLGKLDEFFRIEFQNIEDNDKDIFFRLVEEMRTNLQQRLNKSQLIKTVTREEQLFFEIEIFKENTPSVN